MYVTLILFDYLYKMGWHWGIEMIECNIFGKHFCMNFCLNTFQVCFWVICLVNSIFVIVEWCAGIIGVGKFRCCLHRNQYFIQRNQEISGLVISFIPNAHSFNKYYTVNYNIECGTIAEPLQNHQINCMNMRQHAVIHIVYNHDINWPSPYLLSICNDSNHGLIVCTKSSFPFTLFVTLS